MLTPNSLNTFPAPACIRTTSAAALAASSLACPIVYAGNRGAVDDVRRYLAGKPLSVCENVMPEFNVLNIEPARAAIREGASAVGNEALRKQVGALTRERDALRAGIQQDFGTIMEALVRIDAEKARAFNADSQRNIAEAIRAMPISRASSGVSPHPPRLLSPMFPPTFSPNSPVSSALRRTRHTDPAQTRPPSSIHLPRRSRMPRPSDASSGSSSSTWSSR